MGAPSPSPSYSILLAIIIPFSFIPDVAFGRLLANPPVLFLDEDWPLARPLDVQICTDRRVEEPLELQILSGNDARMDGSGGVGLPPFGIVPLNKTCAGLVLNAHQDADNVPNEANQQEDMMAAGKSPSPTIFSLIIEDLDNKQRAALQIELVDVNDNAPRFLDGPFPVELVIPVDSPPGFLLRRLTVFDPDKGIGGIIRFLLSASSNRSSQLFALEAQQCSWPKCTVELRLREQMVEGERVELRVKARDGAGLTQKRANEAEVTIWVMAIGEQTPQKMEEQKTEDADDEDGDEMNLTTSTTTIDEGAQQSTTTASLVTFDKKKAITSPSIPTNSPPTTLPPVQRHSSSSETTTLATTHPPPSPHPPPLPSSPPPPTTFLIDPLDEDCPVGLELLRIPLPSSSSIPSSSSSTGFQFVQLDGSQTLRMLPNGSIQLAKELEAERMPELRAEVRLGPQAVAIIRAKVRPMVRQFQQWMDGIAAEHRFGQSDLIGDQMAVIWLPEALAKYARLESRGEGGWKLDGRELVLTDLRPGKHCCQLELHFRGKKVAKRVCVEVPEREVPVEMHWPANNSRHSFLENVPFPTLLTLNATGPPTMAFSIDANFQDGPLFSIGAYNGQLSTLSRPAQFDFERKSEYGLAIVACPNQRHPQEEESTKCRRLHLQLEVLDANDHCPYFEDGMPEVRIEISEGARPSSAGPFAEFPAAIDRDGSADQRSICYRLVDEDGAVGTFGVKIPDRPALFLLKALDRELVPSYRLRVLAEDCPWLGQTCHPEANGTNAADANNSLAIISIAVSDLNDNPPRFARRHFFAALLPPLQPGEAVLQLRAEDPDESDRGRLRFVWGEGMVQTDRDPLPIADSPFRLNRSSGELSLRDDFANGELDKTTTTSFTFRVRVRDKGYVHEDQASVTISVLDAAKHLVRVSLARNAAAQIEPELARLERLLSALVSARGWLARVHQLTECGSAQCTEAAVYVLDKKMHRLIEAKMAVETMRKELAGEGEEGTATAGADELRKHFGLVGVERAADQEKDHLKRSAAHSGGGLLLHRIRRLFSASPLAAFFALLLLALLALACPFFTCRQWRRCRAASRERRRKLLLGPYGVGVGGVRLVIAGHGMGTNKGGGGGGRVEFLNENAYLAPELAPAPTTITTTIQQQQRRLRWQGECASEDFEFPAPPPVLGMYGSGTMSIPRPKAIPANSVSTEF